MSTVTIVGLVSPPVLDMRGRYGDEVHSFHHRLTVMGLGPTGTLLCMNVLALRCTIIIFCKWIDGPPWEGSL
jgi:hypothetical protein